MQTSEKIKQARKKAGLTQEELALKLGDSQAMISAYEKGLRNPKWETIRSIANALGVSVVEIASDLDNLSKELARKEIRRQIKEIDGSTEFSTTEKEKKITELQNIHFSIGERLHQNEEENLQKLSNTFISLNQNGKELMLNFGDMLFRDEKYRGREIHPSKIKDIPQD